MSVGIVRTRFARRATLSRSRRVLRARAYCCIAGMPFSCCAPEGMRPERKAKEGKRRSVEEGEKGRFWSRSEKDEKSCSWPFGFVQDAGAYQACQGASRASADCPRCAEREK